MLPSTLTYPTILLVSLLASLGSGESLVDHLAGEAGRACRRCVARAVHACPSEEVGMFRQECLCDGVGARQIMHCVAKGVCSNGYNNAWSWPRPRPGRGPGPRNDVRARLHDHCYAIFVAGREEYCDMYENFLPWSSSRHPRQFCHARDPLSILNKRLDFLVPRQTHADPWRSVSRARKTPKLVNLAMILVAPLAFALGWAQ